MTLPIIKFCRTTHTLCNALGVCCVQTGNLQAIPLQLPELFDLEPLLVNLPDSSADVSADDSQQQQQPRTQDQRGFLPALR
jgi:hypothetical protein